MHLEKPQIEIERNVIEKLLENQKYESFKTTL